MNTAASIDLVPGSVRDLVLFRRLATGIKIVYRPSGVVVLVSRNAEEIARPRKIYPVSRMKLVRQGTLGNVAKTACVKRIATTVKRGIGIFQLVFLRLFFSLWFGFSFKVVESSLVLKRPRKKL